MPEMPLSILLHSANQTGRIARRIGALLRAGDCLLLSGPVGAGKTHFARHLIQPLLLQPEDVPSPTFTLVQTYDTMSGELWHADLYRVSSLQEIEELGLTDAFANAICLIEWPDRLGVLTPPKAMSLDFSMIDAGREEQRRLNLSWTDPRWASLAESLRDD